jgi:hypothetical protein
MLQYSNLVYWQAQVVEECLAEFLVKTVVKIDP